MICSSVNLDRFIVGSPSATEPSLSWTNFVGGGRYLRPKNSTEPTIAEYNVVAPYLKNINIVSHVAQSDFVQT
jgi:hypothetical protein